MPDALIGQKVGKLFVLKEAQPLTTGAYNLRARMLVHCDCGNRLIVKRAYLLRKPNPKSDCGSCGMQLGNYSITYYGPEYSCWVQMKERCMNSKHVSYKHYGGRGITICPEWLEPSQGFWNFVRDVGPRPSMNHTLDREDSDGSYTPSNTRWLTVEEQNRNKRNTIRIHPPGYPEPLTIGQFAETKRWSYHKAYNYLRDNGVIQ